MEINVDSEVPVALMQALPLTVATYYDNDLRTHVYREDNEDRRGWRISSGSSQVAMFDRVITSAFTDHVLLDKLPTRSAPAASDLVIAPQIRRIQLATPEETFFEYYEAWIQYDIRFMTPAGDIINSWQITAYGKAPDERFTSHSSGLNNAIGLALRDCGAKLSTGMHKQVAVEKLLTVTK